MCPPGSRAQVPDRGAQRDPTTHQGQKGLTNVPECALPGSRAQVPDRDGRRDPHIKGKKG
eukprot:1189060-Prorocentrum_minimum.AAC.1